MKNLVSFWAMDEDDAMKKILILFCILMLMGLACQMANPAPAAEEHAVFPTITAEKPLEATRTPQKTPKQNTCTVLAENLNLRAFGDISAPIKGYLEAGEQLTPTHTAPAGVWVEVITQRGAVGWVNSKFITCEAKP